ncbi:FAD-dependent oxidoreductase [Candidatus Saccharibacteria bacterium]|nr:FAD-dependent oxidoreductase [Candidatus Saccharibacteria bacterium]
MHDIIIIGAGMAGLTAAIYAARAGKSVLVLESGVIGGQIVDAPAVDNWPGNFKTSGKDLMDKISHQANELGAEIKYEEVVSIDKIEKIIDGNSESKNEKPVFTVKTDEGEYSCSAIIIAVGTEPRKLSEAQAKDAGERPISYCATCDGALYKGKPVVVVGSGNTAKQEIKYLEGICSKVYHIHHDNPIPKDAEAVFVAIGRVPATDFVKGLVELDSDGYIVADESCITSCPGIFVAGDCRTKTVRQLVTAAGDAAVAAGTAVKYLG